MAAHPRVKQYLNVKHNRGPRPQSALALEGTWALREAVRAGVDIEVVFVCPPLRRGPESDRLVAQCRARGVAVRAVGESTFRRMVDREGPDGVAAIAHLPMRRLGDMTLAPDARVVIADAFELAGNVGTIIRCADGAGAACVLLTDRRVRIAQALVVKASMGTVFSMPVVDVDRSDGLRWLRANAFRIVAADPAAPTSYRDVRYDGRVAVVLGSERHGLAPFWRDAADDRVSIPMLGVADSLNVGHAAALLLYEALASRNTG